MFTWTTLHTVAFGSIVVAYIVGQHLRSSRRQGHPCPLPPGPPGLPWVGNVIGINTEAPWTTYSDWAKKYGDLIYTRLLGKDVIIINSEKVAKDLLEQRSRNYADRPSLITTEMCGQGWNTGLIHYGDSWRLQRRFFHKSFNRDAVSRFQSLQYRKSCLLLHQLLETPAQFSEHVFRYTSTIIMNGVYDYDSGTEKDDVTDVVGKVLKIVVAALRPETALVVEAFPTLLCLPSWLPGMSFKKRMVASKFFAKQYVERPFEYSVRRLSNVGFSPSMVHDSLQKGSDVTDEAGVAELKAAAATAFLAGAETSTSTTTAFFLMMALNPHVQKKAQAEIDFAVGRNRLPTIDDRPSLPYVDAILRELYRYNSVLPLSIPRCVVEDDVYNGFYIPKGTVILTNIWSMAHNESKYPRPQDFIPERHLEGDGSLLPDTTEHLAFGFGRRICPGRYFADASVWSVIASVLSVFQISKAKDANGVEIPLEPKFGGGLTTQPLPFACNIVPRTPGMNKQMLEQLITANTVWKDEGKWSAALMKYKS